MNFRKLTRSLGATIGVVGCAAALLRGSAFDAFPGSCILARQSQSEQRTAPPNSEAGSQQVPRTDRLEPKKKKVWTNEDLVQLRTPADCYGIEQEQKQADEKAAKESEAAIRATAKTDKQARSALRLPSTREETEKMITDDEADLKEETDLLNRIRKESETAPDAQPEEKQKEIDGLRNRIGGLQAELRALRDHLGTLPKTKDKNSPPSPSS